MTPIDSEATTRARIQSPKPVVGAEAGAWSRRPENLSTSSNAMKPPSMKNEPCAMLTTRISPKMRLKPLATMK